MQDSKLQKKTFLVLLFTLIGTISFGQVTGYYLDLVANPIGEIEGIDLTGYTTYDLYVTTEDCSVHVNTIGGYAEDGDCSSDTTINMWFNFPGDVFQNPTGGATCYSYVSPCDPTELCYYDSYVTIGQNYFGDGSVNNFYTNEECPNDALQTQFEGDGDPFGGGDIEFTQGWWGFFGIDNDATLAEPIGCSDLCGVHIMRFTINGNIENFEFNFLASGLGFLNQLVTEEDGNDIPCGLIDTELIVNEGALCNDPNGAITISNNSDDFLACSYILYEYDTLTNVLTNPVAQESPLFTEIVPDNCYIGVLTNDAGCTDTTTYACLNYPEGFTTSFTDVFLCPGEGIVIDGVEIFESGEYIEINFNDSVCDSLVYTVFLYDLPLLDLGEDLTICDTLTFYLDAGLGFETYEWSNGSDEQTILIEETGEYEVTVSTINGCLITTDISIIVESCVEISEIDETDFLIYPNPAKDKLQIEWNSNPISILRIYNLQGKLLREEFPNTNTFLMDIQHLKSGEYILEIQNEHLLRQQKVVKK